MIAKIAIIILICILFPDIFLYKVVVFRNKGRKGSKVWRYVWWLPTILLVIYTIWFCTIKTFVPINGIHLRVFFFLLSIFVLPKLVATILTLLSLAFRKSIISRALRIGTVVILIIMYYILFMGTQMGALSDIKIRYIDFRSKDLPESFSGYKIIQFSDLHLGTYLLPKDKEVVEDLVSKINEEKGDLIVFTGDIQNMIPDEIAPYERILEKLKAKDGVVSILGNHDYSQYSGLEGKEAERSVLRTIDAEKDMGWTVLLNGNIKIGRGEDEITIAGMENDGDGKHFPQKGDVRKTLGMEEEEGFIVMLQHDPSGWRRKILRECNAQITLSGHTHGGQIVMFGWSPVAWKYKEWGGVYQEEDGRMLNVSTGVGGVVPFRFGVKPEICVITLYPE